MTRSYFSSFATIGVVLCAVTPAHGARPVDFAIPAGSLDHALAALADQAGIDIGGIVPGLSAIRSAGLHGRLTPEQALDRLLAGTLFEARDVGASSYRILARPASKPRIARQVSRTEMPAGDIIVTASKRGTILLRFPGSISTTLLDRDAGRPASATDLHNFAAALPILQSTDLGAGRNKIFVRGVADSSFNGPTQGTTGVYFGDVQVGYSGPDPNLNLFDVGRVEVVEGPQGTLYGAGAIGGVITLTPNAPDLAAFGGEIAAGVTATQGGAAGYDGAAMLNAPIVSGKLGLRGVAYRAVDGGFIDDRMRGLSNVNRTVTDGGRLAARYAPAPGWTIDASMVRQQIDARDSQYAEREQSGLARRSTLAQPFSDRFLLGRLVVSRQWDSGLKLISATGWVDRDRRETFDASRPDFPGPILYTAQSGNRLLTHETRLSRSLPKGASWVAGLAFLYDREAFDRLLGAPDNPIDINGVTNRTISLALFGEATLPLGRRLALTAGGRLTRARTDGDPSTATRNTVFVHGKISFRLDPALGASFLLTPRLAAFARYQSGFRTGGLSVARGIGRVADFQADKIGVVEAGFRLQRAGEHGVAGSVALSYAEWDDIQADLVNIRGLPYSTNIGQGEIKGLEATADWRPLDGLALTGAMFLSRSRLKNPVAALEAVRGTALPNVPRVAIGSDVAYHWATGETGVFKIFGGAHYRSHSVLGTGLLLGVRQGASIDQAIGASWSRGGLSFTARLDNIADTDGSRFALGNPFQLASRTQYVPMRPRNVRLGASYRW